MHDNTDERIYSRIDHSWLVNKEYMEKVRKVSQEYSFELQQAILYSADMQEARERYVRVLNNALLQMNTFSPSGHYIVQVLWSDLEERLIMRIEPFMEG
jgi:hypothetical protein